MWPIEYDIIKRMQTSTKYIFVFQYTNKQIYYVYLRTIEWAMVPCYTKIQVQHIIYFLDYMGQKLTKIDIK